jgi:UDP-3-O-[3-hydroxymyristoyl] glucosamine N-acyltransferase
MTTARRPADAIGGAFACCGVRTVMAMTLQQIAELVGGEVRGEAAPSITGVEVLDRAAAGHLTFIGDEAHARRWAHSGAPAGLVRRDLDLSPGPGRVLIAVDDVDLALAKVLEAFAPPPVRPAGGVDASARIDPTARLAGSARIGPLCVIGAHVQIGADAVLHGAVTVMDHSIIGTGCVLWPGTVVRERCGLGDRTIAHPNVTIGSDGFGYRPSPDGRGLVKIPQIGTVEVGCDVEIGAGTCIDRAKVGATTIGDGTKIDNLVQVGHNCRIGRRVVIAGLTGLAGSVDVGDGVQIGGACDLKDHITIGPGARIGGGAQVMNDVPPGETWAGSPAQEYHKAGREYAAIRQLPEVMKKVRKHLRDQD